MNYKIEINSKPKKFIFKQPKPQQERLLKAIYQLPNNPDIVKMAGTDKYRLRVGDYRIIFEIHRNILLIVVTDANNRGDIYKRY